MSFFRLRPVITICLLLILFLSSCALSQTGSWSFAVSGDSRNCGNVVMPAIAASVAKSHAEFYWHMGDLRAISHPDEDYQHEPEHRGQPPDRAQYLNAAWDDYIQNQLSFFGDMPVFVGIGNHELIQPKTREEFVTQFGRWLNSSVLQKQRQEDQSQDPEVKTYYHWIQGGVDFVYLDNASPDQFDSSQMAWFESVLKRAVDNSDARAVVVGMHEALPDSLAAGHSMSEHPAAVESGRKVYVDLLQFNQQTHKHVYILASHSHFYMRGIFDSDYWREHGGVLPGWIVGTGGAVRYALPAEAKHAKEARQKIYGYLLGTVHADGSIRFKFHEIKRKNIPDNVAQRYTPQFVDFCFNENTSFGKPAARK
jgi:hypothetical protein